MNNFYSHESHGTTPETEGVNNGGISYTFRSFEVNLVDVLYDSDIPAVDDIVVDITYREKFGDSIDTHIVTNLPVTSITGLLEADLAIALYERMKESPGDPNDPASAILASQRLQEIADDIERQFLADH